jgi:hypothetical protein
MTKNKITTLSYFVKRLKDSNYEVWKLFNNYDQSDPRKWTVVVDPGGTSVFVTCYENRDFKGERMFEFNDGGRFFPKNFSIKTASMEIIITTLIDKKIPQLETK